ncbi:Ger(x)C family spore germination protein [Alkalihalobacterium alkalinitrilicum]|uniref:Ger(x)C family spore germination protein n=1 Tax=Alkalihalobacterium alkalinitrilicum TaxID=427920 RepID=UPI0013031DEB|nr:Ger(x)C family spore germination protein [Alkalihalobacterium alkalinitrilicum]
MGIAEGFGRDVLNADAPIEQYPSEMLRELTIGATTKPVFLKTFMYHLIEEGLDAYAPVVKLVETEPGDKGEVQTNIQINGLAILKKDKLVELLEPEKAKYVLITMNQANLPTFKIDAPDHTGKLMIQLQEYETNLSPSINEEEVTIEINIRAKGALVENMSTYSMRNYENKKKVEQHLEEKLKTDIKQTIHHLQSLGSDPIGFGQLLRRNKVNEWMKLKGQWENVYPKIEIKVDARVHIEHEGVLSKPLEIKEYDS